MTPGSEGPGAAVVAGVGSNLSPVVFHISPYNIYIYIWGGGIFYIFIKNL